jgi:uncharacterized protein (DUF305 family)
MKAWRFSFATLTLARPIASQSHSDTTYVLDNVGKVPAMPTNVAETDERENADIVILDVNTTIRIADVMIPHMIQRWGFTMG